ncbi:alpha/beta hydrolase [Amycolatopsis minnesotensis]|uniref:S-formylglutathione hydrolase FrmB n=1 Tax=Amycolatopsis minnesotensis TaxID=337894 RepID=A0ABP5DTR8_9PSEU
MRAHPVHATGLLGVLAMVAACAAPSPTAPPSAAQATGRLENVTIPATASAFRAREAHVYLPPETGEPGKHPVLVLLAGVPGATDNWFTHGGAAEFIDEFATAHDGQAPVVVAPDDTGEDNRDLLCMDSPAAAVDTYLSQDVPAWLETQPWADQDTSRWAVGGLSYGGTCAYQLAVRHPALFPTFLDFSGESRPMLDTVENAVSTLFDGNSRAYAKQDPLAILATARLPGTAGMLAVGDDDEPYTGEQREVETACRRAGVQITSAELPGGHDWDVWRAALRRAEPFLGQRMKLDGTRP